MSTVKKVAVVALAFVMVASGVGFAKAVTTTDLQAQIAALLAQINALQAQLSAQGGAATTSSYAYTKDLTLGSKGDDVTALQQMLISGGFLTAVSAPTGYFGPLTKTALAAYQASVGISPAAGYFGPKTRAYVASLPGGGGGAAAGGGTSTTTPVVSGAPLTVSLASDSPSGGNILAGSANNTVTKLVFTAGNSADVKITGLTVKSYGTAALGAADILNVKMFDGSTQIGLTQTQIQGIATFTFAPAITITKGTSKILSVVVDIAATGVATPSATVKMGIESAAKILGGTTFAGTFPIIGSSNVIVAGGSIGTLTITPGAPVAVNNTYVGATNVVLGNFVVTSGTNEDVKVTQFRVSYGAGLGTLANIQDTDITNLRVQVDGANIGVPATFSTRRASIDLTTPIILTKGSSKIFTIIGDIASGAARIIELDNAVNSINGVGVTSGVGVTGGGPLAALGAPNQITIGAGILSISVSTTSPAGQSANVVRSITQQVLGVYDFRAVGEDVLVNTVGVGLNDGVAAVLATVTNVGLYDEVGALLSNQVNYNQAQLLAVTGQAFALNWLIPANTTKKLFVKGTTSGLTGAGPDVLAVTLSLVANPPTLTQSVVATGMSSSGLVGPNNVTSVSVLALPALTINATATYLAVPDTSTSIYNQAVIAPAAQVTLGYLRITAQNEDQTYRRLQLSSALATGAGSLVNIASGVALFDGNTQVTNFVAPLAVNTVGTTCFVANTNAAGDVCFTAADTITPTTFTLNTPKVLKIVANVLAANAENRTFSFNITSPGTVGRLETLGKSSGLVADNNAAINIVSNVGAYNETGTYGVRSNVVEVTKDAASPSGNVRGTFMNNGIWDLNLNGTANTVAVSSIVFTSKVGLPNTGTPVTAAMFRLYDYTNSLVIANASAVNITNGTVVFAGIPAANLTITRGTTFKIALQVTTTNTAVWPINTSLQWSIRSSADVNIGAYGVAANAVVALDPDLTTVIGIPAFALAAGAVAKDTQINAVGVAYNFAQDRIYLKATNAVTVAAGDIRLVVTPADYAAGRLPGSVVVAADADFGDTNALSTVAIGAVGSIGMTGNPAAAFVIGRDGLYIKGANVGATVQLLDIRAFPGGTVATGANYTGQVGYGGVSWSLPADANAVTLP